MGPACGPELATLSAKRSAPGQHNRASLFLVDLPTARDLLLRAKHLFVAAHGVPGLRSDLCQRGRITVPEAAPEVGPQHPPPAALAASLAPSPNRLRCCRVGWRCQKTGLGRPFHRSPLWSDIGAVERTVLQRAAAVLGGHIWRLVIVLHHGELFTPQ
jgi:hypothetical protein